MKNFHLLDFTMEIFIKMVYKQICQKYKHHQEENIQEKEIINL